MKGLHPEDRSYSLDDDMPIPAWNGAKGKTSTPKGNRKSAATNMAKALVKRLMKEGL